MMTKLIHAISNFVISLIFFSLIVVDQRIQYISNNVSILNNFSLALIVVSLVGMIYRLRSHFSFNISKRFLILFLFTFSLVLFIVQVFLVHNYYFYTGWDAKTVRDAAFVFIERPHLIAEQFGNYFSFHINQVVLTILSGTIMRLAFNVGIVNVYFVLVVFNIALVNISAILATLSFDKLINNPRKALFFFILFSALFQFSPWLSIPYSDTISLFFVTLIFYLFSYRKHFSEPLAWFLMTVVASLGYLIKPQVVIVYIALVVFEINNYISDHKLRHAIKRSLLNFLMVVFALQFSFIVRDQLFSNHDFGIQAGRSFTYTHYLMTGLNRERYGVYLETDAEISYQFGTVAEREAENWRIIRQRLDDFGFLGYLDFFTRKLLTNYNDGNFAWNGEGGFVLETFDEKTTWSTWIRNFMYPDGEFYRSFYTLLQGIWIFVWFLMLGNIFLRRPNSTSNMIIELAFLGSFIFIQVFEARARYLINYLPFMVMLAILGFDGWLELLDKRLKKDVPQ